MKNDIFSSEVVICPSSSLATSGYGILILFKLSFEGRLHCSYGRKFRWSCIIMATYLNYVCTLVHIKRNLTLEVEQVNGVVDPSTTIFISAKHLIDKM